MHILGIETSCDETACAVVREGKEILSNVISSQIDLHQLYGGVVPELACRRHIETIIPVIDQALIKSGLALQDIDAIAVARGPGLVGALLVGVNCAKALSLALQKPLIGVSHIEAHLYAALMSHKKEVQFPALGVVVSGGHTALVLVRAVGRYSLIGQTVDDAIGEAFDKVAKILGLSYPGGPQVEALAKNGDPSKYSFSSGKVKGKPYAFSFSGLKTAVLYAVKGKGATYKSESILSEGQKPHIAASFQRAAFQDLMLKVFRAADEFQCETILFGGGVTNNQEIRRLFKESSGQKELLWPIQELTLDNAAMIAGLGFHKLYLEGPSSLDFEVRTTVPW